MPVFAHDPSRVHPPASAGGFPSVAEEERTSRAAPEPRLVLPPADRTKSTYTDGITLISVALGENGEPHRVVFVTTQRRYRNQHRTMDGLALALADMDADGRDSLVYIRNVEPDCDIPRLVSLFERLGYVQAAPDPDYPDTPVLARSAGTVSTPQ